MTRVVHFEIAADKMDRAKKFYEKVFGWKIEKWSGPVDYWMVMTGDDKKPGINGGLVSRQNMQATCNTIDVPSVDEFVKKIKQQGGDVIAPKMAIPGVGYLAYCKDTEGNIFGIMQEDKKAK